MSKRNIKSHQCALGLDTEEFERLPRYAPWRQRLRRDFKMCLLMSYNNPRSQLYYRTNTAISLARKRHAQSRYNYVIHPFSPFRMNWEFFMLIAYLAYLFIIPLTSLYAMDVGMIIACLLYLVTVADFIVTFFTGYTVDHLKQVVLVPKRIAFHYVRSVKFFFDVLCVVPTEFVLIINYNIVGMEDRMVFFTITSCLSTLKIYKVLTVIVYTRHLTEYWKLSWSIVYFRFTTMVFILLHWCSCLEALVPFYVKVLTGRQLGNSSWIMKRPQMYPERYFEATFKAAGHLLCVANPMYRAETPEDGIVAFIVSVIGYLLSCLGLVIFVQMMFRMHNSKIKYECVMNELSQYMRHKQLPMSMQQRITDYYEFRYRKSYFREAVIYSILSERLKQDINSHVCTILVNKVEIFQNIPEAVLNNIVSSLHPEVFLPNDIIVKAATTGDCMYFIYTGTVASYTPTGKEMYHLQDGNFFGLVAMIAKDQKRNATIVAIETTEVFRLMRSDFNNHIRTLPEVYKKLELIAERRKETSLVMEEIHRKQILEKTMKMRYDSFS